MALKHARGQRPAKKQSQKERETPARAKKKARPAASTAVCDTISRNWAILHRDVSTLVAKTRGSECLPENPCGVLWWPARALGIPLVIFPRKLNWNCYIWWNYCCLNWYARELFETSILLSVLAICQISQILWFNSNSVLGPIFKC